MSWDPDCPDSRPESIRQCGTTVSEPNTISEQIRMNVHVQVYTCTWPYKSWYMYMYMYNHTHAHYHSLLTWCGTDSGLAPGPGHTEVLSGNVTLLQAAVHHLDCIGTAHFLEHAAQFGDGSLTRL